MEIGLNIDTMLSVSAAIGSAGVLFFIIRINWKQYGTLLLISGVVGLILCYLLISLKLYNFPFRIFPAVSEVPFVLILTFFPMYVLLGVRFSPQVWRWKIPFYWVLVHFGVFAEYIIEKTTDIIKYGEHWGIWDSYIWWWIYLLVFEAIGGLVVKPAFRKPLDTGHLRYGRLGWFIVHFLLITTFFMAGVLAGSTLLK
jgi:hypothetical protein